MSNRLVIQLARLGDLVQTLPAVTALRSLPPDNRIDLLCAAPLVPVGKLFPGVERVFPWDGTEWGEMAKSWSFKAENVLSRAAKCMERYQADTYEMAYNLNNHSRAIFAAHLMATNVSGPGCYGPLSSELPSWVKYLNLVGAHRGNNRVHLADAFCGLCGVKPPSHVAMLQLSEMNWPRELDDFMTSDGIRVGIVIGSGDADRRIPLHTWEQWISTFLSTSPQGRVVLIGGTGERELTYSLLDRIPSLLMGRIWNMCGQTTFPQLAHLLSYCDWVIGSDTGPLHLGVACGAKTQGLYFSRARVHETGPYGKGHWVWQAERSVKRETLNVKHAEVGGRREELGVKGKEGNETQRGNGKVKNANEGVRPEYWPVRESVELLLTETCSVIPEGWSLWRSQQDHYGAHFVQYGNPNMGAGRYREQLWEKLHGRENVDWDSVVELMNESEFSYASQGLI